MPSYTGIVKSISVYLTVPGTVSVSFNAIIIAVPINIPSQNLKFLTTGAYVTSYQPCVLMKVFGKLSTVKALAKLHYYTTVPLGIRKRYVYVSL